MKNIDINGEKLRELFSKTDERIETAEKEREAAKIKEVEEATKKREELLKRTDEIANKIVGLVYDVLTTVDTKQGIMKPEFVKEKGLGSLTSLYPSTYEITNDGLKIVLDYSYGDYGGKYGGESFIRKDNFCGNSDLLNPKFVDSEYKEIDFSYLQEKLAEKDIIFDYYEDDEPNDMTEIVSKVLIRLDREKKKNDGKEPYTK